MVYWKLEDGKSYAIVGYDKKTGKLEKAVEIPLDVYRVIPKKGFLICDKNVYILIPSQESIYVLKVVSWQSADEFMKEIEKNDSISVNSSEKLNEQTKS